MSPGTPNRVLVIAAHPDDELLGPGGTLARHTAAGDDVHAVILADGATSRYDDAMVGVLADCAEQAGKVLGLSSVQVHSFSDQRLDTVPVVELTRTVEEHADELRPTIVYTHFPGDVNVDHGRVAQAAWIACRPYVVPGLRRFAVYETASSTEWAWPLAASTFAPNLFVDITPTLDAKLEAMSCYSSELREYPHPRSLAALRERAAYWGSRIGVAAAEAFQILREVQR
ncbi:MAG TPA: PIG-L deacetylase family protein [Jatrophihabitans sp.]|nr:PIG-L deacetylase family protein [Jatrophihabitans sp.]